MICVGRPMASPMSSSAAGKTARCRGVSTTRSGTTSCGGAAGRRDRGRVVHWRSSQDVPSLRVGLKGTPRWFEVVVASRGRAVHRQVDRQIVWWIVPGQRLRVGFDIR